jgi:RHS repeat-associated protein
LLTSATVGGNAVALAYDPLLRLTQVAGAATTRFGYDGLDTLIETDTAGTNILRRYAPGDGVDEPVVWYEGGSTTDRRWLHADERGSIVSVSDASGNMFAINTYDEFGNPGAANIGRFQYTGQKWLPEIGLYDYKARMYLPGQGRFPQTDPVGYGSGPNIYAYVRADPVNRNDPLGLDDAGHRPYVMPNYDEILVTAPRLGGCGEYCVQVSADAFLALTGSIATTGNESQGGQIVVTCDRACQDRIRRRNQPKESQVETPSLDPYTFFHHFRSDSGETICLTSGQFARATELGQVVGATNPNGANLVSYYGTPLENTFGSATLYFRNGQPVGFFDRYDFNVRGANRSLRGQLKTIGGAIVGAGGTPFVTRYPC